MFGTSLSPFYMRYYSSCCFIILYNVVFLRVCVWVMRFAATTTTAVATTAAVATAAAADSIAITAIATTTP